MTGESGLLGVSLFTGAGIGDLGFRAAGVRFAVMSELEADRASLASLNFPEAEPVVGDIWEVHAKVAEKSIKAAAEAGSEVFLLSCTAPCQGMSKNGKGKLLNLARSGQRPKMDPRNRLILPALEAIREIRPRWVFFENVSEMSNTVIEDLDGAVLPILDVISESLAPEYRGRAYDLEFADYGVPQRRRRLLTVYTRSESGWAHLDAGGEFVPAPTHSARPSNGLSPWVSVSEALAGFPPLDAGTPQLAEHPSLPFHRVPLLDDRKYRWVSRTPEGQSAFDNQCDHCGHEDNTKHGASHDDQGINRAHRDTPVHCEHCGKLLPRPHVIDDDGQPRVMRGYTSAYKRMSPDLPAPALTRNLSYACSDQKVHPTEHRVLSLAEAFRVHTLDDYEYAWGPMKDSRGRVKPAAPDSLIRLVLGESIPPRVNELVLNHILAIDSGSIDPPKGQGLLFNHA